MFEILKSDAELWQEVRNDNRRAFDALFNRYWARLYKIAYQRLNDEESSLEIVHDVFLSLWNRRKELEIVLFQNFLVTAIRYQIYSRIKSRRLSVVYKAEFDEKETISELNIGDSNIRDLELQSMLDMYLGQLPTRCRQIFQLSRMEYLSNQDIADRLGVSKKTVENQLTAALKHLRIALKNIASLIILFVIFNL